MSVDDLETLRPEVPGSFEEVRLLRQRCVAHELGTSEAALYFDYATDLSPDAAARAYIASAKAAGWTVNHPRPGKSPAMVDGRIHLVFGRTEPSLASLTGWVFPAETPPAGTAGPGFDTIMAAARATGASFWMQAGTETVGPNLPGALLPTPDPGISR
jgi:hypothetical protein